MESIEQTDMTDAKGSTESLASELSSMRHVSRIFQQCALGVMEGSKIVDEGNTIVRRWDAELRRPESKNQNQANIRRNDVRAFFNGRAPSPHRRSC